VNDQGRRLDRFEVVVIDVRIGDEGVEDRVLGVSANPFGLPSTGS
jgi:hypothetical protein